MHECRGELGELGELGGEKFLQIFQIFQHGHGTAKNISAAHTSCIFFLQWIAEIYSSSEKENSKKKNIFIQTPLKNHFQHMI